GNGSFSNNPVSTPVQAVGVAGATHVAAGTSTTCATTMFATYCWGLNQNGALGDGTTTTQATPVVPQINSTAVATNYDHTCFASTFGFAACSGNNANGQLGNNSTTSSPNPGQITTFRGTTSLAVGVFHSCAVDALGKAYCWGSKGNGQVGNGTSTSTLV